MLDATSFKRRLYAKVLAGWLLLSGVAWVGAGWQAGRPPPSPWLGNSDWREQSIDVVTHRRPLCVMVDPFAWGIYGQDCIRLNRESNLHGPWRLTSPVDIVNIPVPPSVQHRDVLALAFVAHINRPAAYPVEARVASIDGAPLPADEFSGARNLSEHGNAIILRTRRALQPHHNLEIKFSEPVRLMQMTNGEGEWELAVVWMGRPIAGETERDR